MGSHLIRLLPTPPGPHGGEEYVPNRYGTANLETRDGPVKTSSKAQGAEP